MIIREFEAVNFCQHEHQFWTLGTGVTGICGPIGSGKSNALKGMYLGLTNDAGRNVGVKADNVRQGISKKAESYVRILAHHGDVEFEVIRGLRPSYSHYRCGEVRLEKDADIRVELEELLQVNRRIIDDFVFVDQGQIAAFLNDTPGERAKVIQQLCQTEAAAKLYSLLGRAVSADAGFAVTDETLDEYKEVRRSFQQAKQDREAAEAELEGLRESVLSDKALRTSKRLVRLGERGPELEQKTEAARTQVEQKLAQSKELRKRVAGRGKVVDRLARERKELHPETARTKLNRAIQIEALRENRDEYRSRREGLKRELEATETPQLNVKSLKKLLNRGETSADIHRRVGELETEIEHANHCAQELDDGTCPVCGTDVDHMAVTPDQYREKADKQEALKQQYVKLYVILKGHETETASVARQREIWTSERARLLDEIKQADQEIKRFNLSDEDIEQARSVLLRSEELAPQLESAKEELAKADREAAAAQAEVDTLQVQLDEFEAELQEIHDSRKKIVRAKKALAAHEEVAVQVAKLSESVKYLGDREEELSGRAKRLKRRIARGAEVSAWVARAEEMRELLKALPQLVHQTALEDVEQELNQTLELLGATFRVEAEEGLGFLARFIDGTERAVKDGRLSGGQKAILAIAFRLAISSQFAGQLGMMVLDEPTTNLDEDHVVAIGEVFQRLGEVSKTRGTQVIVVTHDHRLMSYFNHTIRLGD